jgi:preprotein translocase subunit SecG
MSILYILLTVVMFGDCVLLVFLVLLQLPKKEAGMGGTAFGGAATDALFGAGSGNVLTKITKYVAGIFFGLAILMAFLAAHKPKSDAALLAEKLIQRTAAPMAAPTAAESAPAAAPPGSGLLQLSNLPPAPVASSNAGTNPPPPPAIIVNTNK